MHRERSIVAPLTDENLPHPPVRNSGMMPAARIARIGVDEAFKDRGALIHQHQSARILPRPRNLPAEGYIHTPHIPPVLQRCSRLIRQVLGDSKREAGVCDGCGGIAGPCQCLTRLSVVPDELALQLRSRWERQPDSQCLAIARNRTGGITEVRLPVTTLDFCDLLVG